MKIHLVIPARYNSSRLPGKPLLKMNGHTMIYHVYHQALQAQSDTIYVATDDKRVFGEVKAFGGNAIMTDAKHQSGTDRIAEVATKLKFQNDDIVVNLQGDEPLMPPELVDLLSNELQTNPSADIATLACPIKSYSSVFNPNVVKVVCDNFGKALFFSRAPIPWDRANFDSLDVNNLHNNIAHQHSYMRHVGLYAYNVKVLLKLSSAPVCKLEELESLEQLRALSLGMSLFVKTVEGGPPHGVDTLDDYKRIKQLMEAKQ